MTEKVKNDLYRKIRYNQSRVKTKGHVKVMSEPIAKRQMFEYDADNPFHIYNIPYSRSDKDTLLLNHWHEELEIVYTLRGHSLHYIDGKCIESQPGRLIVVNSESSHNIIPDRTMYGGREIAVTVLIVSRQFLEVVFPNFKTLYFMNEKETACPEICDLMTILARYDDSVDLTSYEKIYVKGLVLQLLYHMTEEGVAEKDAILPLNNQKNIERLKGVLQYIENHYMEKLSQAEVAEKFYFSKEYFARFFKKHTGMTFIEYLTKYRVHKARIQLMSSDAGILEIALNHGFSDDRRLILAFKEEYGTTPFQYRKMERNKEI